jgi:hypothetical protein
MEITDCTERKAVDNHFRYAHFEAELWRRRCRRRSAAAGAVKALALYAVASIAWGAWELLSRR